MIFLRFAEVRFTARRAVLEKAEIPDPNPSLVITDSYYHAYIRTNAEMHPSDYIWISEGGLLPYIIENVDLEHHVVTLSSVRRTGFLPKLIALTNAVLGSVIKGWKVIPEKMVEESNKSPE